MRNKTGAPVNRAELKSRVYERYLALDQLPDKTSLITRADIERMMLDFGEENVRKIPIGFSEWIPRWNHNGKKE